MSYSFIPDTLNQSEIYAQPLSKCGETCLVAASDIIHKTPATTRNEFIQRMEPFSKLESPISLDVLVSIGTQLKLRAKIVQLIELNKNPLAIARLAWASKCDPQSSHRFYDDEHYVLVLGFQNTDIVFWDPSYGWNSKGLQKSDGEPWIGQGKAVWTMPFSEFKSRNLALDIYPGAKDLCVLLSAL